MKSHSTFLLLAALTQEAHSLILRQIQALNSQSRQTHDDPDAMVEKQSLLSQTDSSKKAYQEACAFLHVFSICGHCPTLLTKET